MKKINAMSVVILITFLSTLFISCKKSVVGPAGEKGATGQQGQTGAQGNANVKSVSFSTGCNWKADSTGKNYNYTYHIADLNTSVLAEGIVALYLGEDQGSNGNEWIAMPFSGKDLNYSFKIELSTVEIYVSSPKGTMPVNPGSQKFKLVIIPPAG